MSENKIRFELVDIADCFPSKEKTQKKSELDKTAESNAVDKSTYKKLTSQH